VNDHDALLDELRRAVRGPVDASTRRRAEYSSDASNYRVVPRVVVFPRDVEDILATADVARRSATPMTMRGGGTSVSGNAVGPGIVVDTSRHLNKITAVDPQAGTATVQPGVVLGDLQRATRRFGLRFGPDPSTHNRATLGGMIGNNACGAHAVAYGRTVDNVVDLDVVDGTGRRFTAARGLSQVAGLRQFVAAHQAVLRAELGRFSRQLSGYGLQHLLPEHGEDLARAFVGSEGTTVTVLGATVRLCTIPAAQVLVVLGYPDLAAAADAVPALLAHRPLAVEGLDARLVDVVRRRRGESRVPPLPPGAGWLMVEMAGGSPDEALAAASGMMKDAATSWTHVLPDGPQAASLWRIREDGAGLSGRTPSGAQAWPGWEDAAVPIEHLGAYLRDFDALMASYGVEGLPYGHFGDGCVHVRLNLPMDSRFSAFLGEAARLVARHGGSLSGEHGDGRARSALLDQMYSPAAIAAFAAFKGLFDPGNLLNPGVIVQPNPVHADLRRPQAAALRQRQGFALRDDAGDFTTAVHRCVGVAKCRADTSADGGFMCPSFLATRDERDSTRGRARVLQDMANGRLITGGWRSAEVHDVLDLCLSCKTCSSDCPAGVDMARYKSEVLHRSYRRRLRPATHYALGWLPRWLRLASVAPSMVNRVLSWEPAARLLLPAAGMDARRSVPPLAPVPFRRAPTPRPPDGERPRGRVVLWVDCFSDAFSPDIGHAAVRLLGDAGYDIVIPQARACCGLTWITTGQLPAARRQLLRLLDVLVPHASEGLPIVGLEPSCLAVLRSDLLDLLPDDPRAGLLAGAARTLAELLTSDGWSPPRMDEVAVVAQPHCHHHSVMGYDADRAVLAASGADVRTVSGCCGLAGNFGMEKGHYDVSVAIARRSLLAAWADAPAGAVLLADGFSCRTQAAHLAGVRGLHLAELLANRLGRR
jgi:FAD/FMN-containing dehydrogenase/Fe-S oxidoreductase